MPWLLLLLVLALPVAEAAQAIDGAILRALETARIAQEKGDYGKARQALEQAEARAGSLEETLLWRSRGYLAWAQGNNAEALRWLSKVVGSDQLDDVARDNERLNLARLSLAERRFGKVVELLAPRAGQGNEEVLKMLVQAYQGLGQHSKALPLAERYVKAHPQADDAWLQFLVAGNAELKRYDVAQRWQRRLLARQPNEAKGWWQLAGLQQLSGNDKAALATLRAARLKGVAFSAAQLDNLVLMASAAGQPWQGARLLEGLLDADLLQSDTARRERLALLWWQARDRSRAAEQYRQLAQRSGSAKHWMNVAQLEFEQARWQAGLQALERAEQAGAEQRRVREWREWARAELSFDRERQLARVD